MSSSVVGVERAVLRQCVHCGRQVPVDLTQCPTCREALPAMPAQVVEHIQPQKHTEIRRGLLSMLMAGVVHYFAGGYSKMDLPFPIHPVVTVYLSPMLFLSGLGLIVYGFFTWKKE